MASKKAKTSTVSTWLTTSVASKWCQDQRESTPKKVLTKKAAKAKKAAKSKIQGQVVKPEKIKGTKIEQKGRGMIRVVIADGKEFPIEASKAVTRYLRSIGQAPEANGNQPKQALKKQKNGPREQVVRTPEEEEAQRLKSIESRVIGDTYFEGKIFRVKEDLMWIKPTNPGSIPETIKGKVKEHAAVFVRRDDVDDASLKISPGEKCRFKFYTDNVGVGGCEVVSA